MKTNMSDTPKCKICGGRTATVSGVFYYEQDSEPYMADVEEEKGYTTITAVHFGNYGEYTWQCDRDIFKDIKLLDLVLVDTVKGEQVVQVIKKSETIDIEGIHKKVIKKLEVY